MENARKEIFGTKDYNLKDATYGQLEAYKEFLISKEKVYSPVSKENYKAIRELHKKAGISEEAARDQLEAMGVKDGKIENMGKESLEQYESFLRNHHGVELTADNSVDLVHNLENKNFQSGIGKLVERAFTPVW